MMDKLGPRHPVSLGLAAIAVGLWLWAGELTTLTAGSTIAGMLVTGAGFGLAMSPLNADALDRSPAASRGVASGVIQSFRNFGSALGMAILGTIIASDASVTGGPGAAASFADAMQTAFYVAAGVAAAGFLIARFFMPAGKQADIE
jgi:MFS family permease